MKGKQLALVLGLLVLLGGLALFMSRRHSAEWSNAATSSDGKILNFPLNDVSHVTIKSSGGELNLVKKDEAWKVTERADYPADFEKVSTLLRKLWEVRAVQDVKIGPSQLARLQLAEPGADANSGTLVDLKNTAGQRLAAVLLGKTQLRNSDQMPNPGGAFPVGRYVMAQDGSNHVFLISDTLDEAQTKPEQWLNRDFVKVEGPKTVAVTSLTPGINWNLTRESPTTPWKLTDAKPNEEFEIAKVAGLANLLVAASFVDVLAPDAPTAETGLDKPSLARIETFDGFHYEFRIGKLMGENYPVLIAVKADLPKERTPGATEKPEDKARLDQEFQTRHKQLADKLAQEQKLVSRPYLMARGTIEQLLKDRSTLMADKAASPTPAAAAAAATSAKPAKASATPSPASPPSPSKRPK